MKRIFHPWYAWECAAAGMYKRSPSAPMKPNQAEREYAKFLRDTKRFKKALGRVLNEWPISCENFLSNENINRIAWLGQASMCIDTGVPEKFRSGFMLLTNKERRQANETARRALELWIFWNNQGNYQPEDDFFGFPRDRHRKINAYVERWHRRAYQTGLPEEVQHRMTELRVAPSYKAIAVALLKNDHPLKSLGFSEVKPDWYYELKKFRLSDTL